MRTLPLLIVSPDAGDTRALTAVVPENRFAVVTAENEEAAVEHSCREGFDVVIAGKTLSGEAVRKLKAFFKAASPGTAVITQENGEDEAISRQLNEVYLARQKARLQHIAVSDSLDGKNLESQIRLN